MTEPLECVVVTRAEKGASVYWRNRRKHVASESGSKANVIGAGDAFLAGFLSSWSTSSDPFTAGKAGSLSASRFIRAMLERSSSIVTGN